MHPLSVYVSSCVTEGLLEVSPIPGVYWSTALSKKLGDARRRGMSHILLDLGDFLISDYQTLVRAKAAVRTLAPGEWAMTEIHHIVENFHLQFLGVIQPISHETYERSEPCVLMGKKHHDTHVDNIVGGAETVVMEAEPFDFVAAFRTAHPGISGESRTRQGQLRAAWVRQQEGQVPPPVTRNQVRDTLLEIYRFAYQEPELRPLKLIAESVIRSMPL